MNDKSLISMNNGAKVEQEVVSVEKPLEQRVEQNGTSEGTTNHIDKIDSIVSEIVNESSIKNDKTQVSTYLDDDVHRKYIRFGKKNGKGSRASLINKLLREALKDY